MKIADLFIRRAAELQWRMDFMTVAIRHGLSFNASARLAKSKRALHLRDGGYSAIDAYESFERVET